MEIGIDAYRTAVVAAFTSRPDLLQKALANPGEPVKFAFTSVSLLTPDFVRGDFKIKGPHGNEKAMLEAQNRAYEKLLYRNILLGSGNHELQKYNAGIAGYMLENAPELPKRIGDNLAYRVFIGGSRLASK